MLSFTQRGNVQSTPVRVPRLLLLAMVCKSSLEARDVLRVSVLVEGSPARLCKNEGDQQ